MKGLRNESRKPLLQVRYPNKTEANMDKQRRIVVRIIKDKELDKGLARCYKCNEVKPVDQFHKKRKRSRGIQTVCKDCARVANTIHMRKYRARKRKENGERR